eukprot:jgi/Hompol1/4982/HPOL_004105-RA
MVGHCFFGSGSTGANTDNPATVEPSIECIASLEGHENEVKSVAWSVSGSLLATCSRDKSVWIWEVIGDEEYECSCVLQEHSQDVKSVQWHPHDEVGGFSTRQSMILLAGLPANADSPLSAQILASASYDDTVKIWREEDSDWYCSDTLVGHTSTVWAIDFDASGNKLASVSDDKSLRIWKLDTAGRYKSYAEALNHHERAIYSVAWSKHTGLIATASGDNCIKICRLVEHDGEHGSIETVCSLPESHGLNDINHVVWCPLESHSELLASAGDDGVVRIWRVHRD